MKTERMVLLVTPEEKARITTESVKLGVSASEYVRRIVSLLDADDLLAAEELAKVAPQLGEMIDRLEKTFADFREKQAVHEERWAYQHSPEYRDKIRQEVLSDPTINWDHINRVFGGHADDDAEVAA